MHSRDMEYIVGLLKNGKDAEAILSVRRKLNMAFLARTTDLSGKLPVLAFGSTFKKNGDGIQLRRYNGYVLLEVNGLESQSEAEAVRREAAALPQTLLAFVGLSGRSVKIVVPFVLPDGSLPTALKLLMNGFVRVPALKLDASSMERRKRLPRWLPQPHRRRLKGAALIPRRLI